MEQRDGVCSKTEKGVIENKAISLFTAVGLSYVISCF
jgi:hypothetical protein